VSSGEFSVWQWFEGDWHECVAQGVDAKTAVDTFRSYIARPAAVLGIIRKVTITDGGDNTNFQWEFGRGIVYPEPDVISGKKPADGP
jgi:hypothetical protein